VKVPLQPNLVAGRRVRTGKADTILDPYRGGPVVRVPLATRREMKAAIAAAAASAAALAKMPRYRRAEVLRGVAEGIARAEDELAVGMVRASGKPIQYARGEVRRAVVTFRIAAEEAVRFGGEWLAVDLEPRVAGVTCTVERFALGPVAAISPFNFPLNLVAHKLAPAFAVGNPVVLKPPLQCPATALRLGEICLAAGWPEGALSIVHCPIPVASLLVRDPRLPMLSFTGSAKVGWQLREEAGRKKVLLELGGNAAVIVHDDVDPEDVASKVAIGAFAAAGQVCIKAQRIYAHRKVHDRFVAAFVRAAEKLAVGDPMKPETVVGPLIDAGAAERVMAWIDEARAGGAEVLCGGRRKGNVVWPTVIAKAGPKMKVTCEEVFGPVATVAPYRTLDEAIGLANRTRYGLQAGVFTKRLDVARRAFEGLAVGGVIVGDTPMLRVDNFPYGGVKDSGLGREGVRYAMEEMTEPRALVVRY
jgi:glyceraldehyde-3-phosphate dehydrogenase (NADP+)